MDSATKRIANNTIYLYIRLFTTLVVGLYTSRLALEILGVSDYGLYAVVGGVLGLFAFISDSLTSSTSRFINTEMGKEGGDVNACFNINLLLHVCFAFCVFVLAETIGLWYVCNKLNIEIGKISDAIFIYHITIVTTCLGIINSPYRSLFTAHERFKFLAILDIVNSILRLVCILMLNFIPEGTGFSFCIFHFSLLVLYALIMVLTTGNTFVILHWTAYKTWPEDIKHRFVKGWQKYREVLSFGGWNLIASFAYMARSSGSDLILNLFFGTSMNGAFAISKALRQYPAEFATKFDGASAPQIIQAYAAGDKERYTYLANKIGRINILMFLIICFPLLIELDFILHIWLGEVPEEALEFSYINLLVGGVALTAGGAFNVINASGKIKWFKINVSFFFLMCVPLGWLLFYYGYPAYSMLLLFLFADIIQRAIQLTLMKRILCFDSWRYVREAYLSPCIITLIMSLVLYVYSMLEVESVVGKILAILGAFIFTSFLVYSIGLTQNEKKTLVNMIQRI